MSYYAGYMDQGRGLIRIGHGLVTGADIIEVARRQSEERERAHLIRYCLVDFSAVTQFQVVPEDIRRTAEQNAKLNPHLPPQPMILIVAPDPLVFGMARFWQFVSADLLLRAHVAQTREKALEWAYNAWAPEACESLGNYPDLVNYLTGRLVINPADELVE